MRTVVHLALEYALELAQRVRFTLVQEHTRKVDAVLSPHGLPRLFVVVHVKNAWLEGCLIVKILEALYVVDQVEIRPVNPVLEIGRVNFVHRVLAHLQPLFLGNLPTLTNQPLECGLIEQVFLFLLDLELFDFLGSDFLLATNLQGLSGLCLLLKHFIDGSEQALDASQL